MLRPCSRLLYVSLFSLTAVVAAPAQHVMPDPFCSVSYDPQSVHFEKMPTDLISRCPKLRGRYVAAWVYGHLKTSDSEYFLISGLMQFHDEETGRATSIAPEEGDGLAVALRGSTCLVDQADYFLSQAINPAKKATPIVAPPGVVSGILHDGFKRCAAAFGGKQEFLKRVKPGVAIPPVEEQLEIFKKEPS